MPSREPDWWYAPETRWTARLLTPVAALWGAVAVRRLAQAPEFRSALPVVCIGNFTAGGTGKTPLALLIAGALSERGLHPVFLTRGYGSDARQPRLVDAARHTARDVGDEALLLARAGPVMVAADRAKGARAIAAADLDADVIIMDDGLQNPSLAKDLTIAVVDGRRGFGNGRVIPAGPLRAPLAVQLGLADVVVVNGTADEREAVRRHIAAGFSGPVLSAEPQAAGDVAWLAGARVLAYSGIGHPQRFHRLLERLGAKLVAERSFPDHHDFTDADAEALLAEAAVSKSRLITTEKDLVRLAGHAGARGRLMSATRPLPIALRFAGDGATVLMDRITTAITRQTVAAPR